MIKEDDGSLQGLAACQQQSQSELVCAVCRVFAVQALDLLEKLLDGYSDLHQTIARIQFGLKLTLQLLRRVEGIPHFARLLLGFFPAACFCADESVPAVAIDVEPLHAIATSPTLLLPLWATAFVARINLDGDN